MRTSPTRSNYLSVGVSGLSFRGLKKCTHCRVSPLLLLGLFSIWSHRQLFILLTISRVNFLFIISISFCHPATSSTTLSGYYWRTFTSAWSKLCRVSSTIIRLNTCVREAICSSILLLGGFSAFKLEWLLWVGVYFTFTSNFRNCYLDRALRALLAWLIYWFRLLNAWIIFRTVWALLLLIKTSITRPAVIIALHRIVFN